MEQFAQKSVDNTVNNKHSVFVVQAISDGNHSIYHSVRAVV